MLEVLSTYILSLFPEGFDPMSMVRSLVYVIAVAFVVAMLIRLVHEKTSQYNHALSSAMALMFVYVVLVLVRPLLPELLNPVLDRLPLIDLDLDAGTVRLYQFSMDRFSQGCREFLYLLILSICLIGLDSIIPDAKSKISWLIIQFIITCAAVALYSFLLRCIEQFAPGALNSFAPMILVCVLLFMVFLGVLKVVLTLVLAAVNPLLAAISAFFSGNKLGMAMGKSVMCSFVLIAVSAFLNHQGMSQIWFSDVTFVVCAIPMAVLALLWLVIGRIL